MKITKIILLTIIFSLFTLQASAVSFSNLSFGGTGSVNTGNGYFDNDASQFLYSGSRNVYVITETTQINILEPINYANGIAGAVTSINSSLGTLKDGVVHNGYLYFVDGTTLKKKKTRSETGTCESTDTGFSGCIATIATGVGETLRVYNGVLYYTVGSTSLRHLDSDDNPVSDFAIGATTGGATQHNGFAVTTNGSDLTVYDVYFSGVADFVQKCTSSGCVNLFQTNNNDLMYNTLYATTSFIYGYTCDSGCTHVSQKFYSISNSSATTASYITTNIAQRNRVYVGGLSTVGLVAQTTLSYETFNSNEVGISSVPTSPIALTYNLLELSSVQSSYYNNTNIQIVEALQLTLLDNPLLWIDIDNDYRWRVDLIDPNNIPILSFTTGACNGLTICSVTNVITFQPPDTNWTAGTYYAKMYEVNIVEGTSALLITSSSFTVLNNSSSGGSVSPGTGGGGQGGGLANTDTALNLISVFSMTAFWGFVIWLGIVGGVISSMSNSPSGVNGTAVIVVAWLSAIFIALVGLFEPYKIYIIVMSTIIAAVLFKYGRSATVED